MAITIPRLGVEQSQLAVQPMATPEAGISQAGAVIDVNADIQMRKEQRDSDAFTSQRTTELMLESQDLLNQVSLETEDPNKITETFLERYNELYNSKLEGAPNELAKRVLDEKNQQIRAGLGRAAIETQANEVQAKRLSDLDTSLNKIYTTVRTTGNYELGQLALDEALAGAESYTMPSQLNELKKKAVETNKTAYLDRLFESENIGAVRKLINDPDFSADLSVAQVDSYRKGIKTYQEKMAKLAIDDPALAGLSPEQQLKNNPLANVKLYGNDQAKQIAVSLNASNNPDDLYREILAIEQKHGKDYIPAAINQLRASNVKPEIAAALEMAGKAIEREIAGKDANAYKDQIALLQKAGNSGGVKVINSAYKDTFQTSPTNAGEIDQTFDEEASELRQVLVNEGYNFAEIEGRIDIMKTLAKTYRMEDSSRSKSDAIDFAMKSYDDNYKHTQFNDVTFRVPADYVEAVDERLPAFFEEVEVNTPANKAIAERLGVNLKEAARPRLNYKGDGVSFTAPNGVPLLNKEGGLLELKFEDLTVKKTKAETRQESQAEQNKAFIERNKQQLQQQLDSMQ